MNQAELILKLKSGDGTAFPDIVEQCKGMVFNTALGIVQNTEDAEEVTQDVFIQVYDSFGSFRQEAKLSTWIYQVTIRKALDFEKKRRRQKRGGLLKRVFDTSGFDEPASFDHPGVRLDQKENARLLFAAINKLPENQRLAFLLNKLEGLDTIKVAEIMKLSTAAVDSLHSRAKANLKKLLQNYYDTNFN